MEKIIQYCTKELNFSRIMVERTVEQFKKHPDIAKEFEEWIDKQTFDLQDPVVVEGYTAKSIKELAPFFEGIGVYKFLITLRENPEKGMQYIKQGFPLK